MHFLTLKHMHIDRFYIKYRYLFSKYQLINLGFQRRESAGLSLLMCSHPNPMDQQKIHRVKRCQSHLRLLWAAQKFSPPFAARVNPQKTKLKTPKPTPWALQEAPKKPISPTETERCPSEMGRGVSAFRRWSSPCKAFGLNRASSVTSLDLDRTFWIRIRLLRFAPWISKRYKRF